MSGFEKKIYTDHDGARLKHGDMLKIRWPEKFEGLPEGCIFLYSEGLYGVVMAGAEFYKVWAHEVLDVQSLGEV